MALPIERGALVRRAPPRRPIKPIVRKTVPRKPPALAVPGAPAAPPAAPVVDYATDPILLQMRALSQRNVAGAQAAAAAARTQALEQYGYDPSLGAGFYGDPATAAVAQANPTSTLAQLARANAARQTNINESLNRPGTNLFYSSTRGQQLAENAYAYQTEQQSAAQRLAEALAGISGGYAGTLAGEQGRVTDAETAAYQRALDYAIANPVTPASALAPPVVKPVKPAAKKLPRAASLLVRRAMPKRR